MANESDASYITNILSETALPSVAIIASMQTKVDMYNMPQSYLVDASSIRFFVNEFFAKKLAPDRIIDTST